MFLVFGGPARGVRGGWGDFLGGPLRTIEAAEQLVINCPSTIAWWEIVDLRTRQVVATSGLGVGAEIVHGQWAGTQPSLQNIPRAPVDPLASLPPELQAVRRRAPQQPGKQSGGMRFNIGRPPE